MPAAGTRRFTRRAPTPQPSAFLRPGAVAIDIGAGLGEWTVPIARAVGATGRVLAIEPGPRSAAALEATLAANGLRQVEVIRCAIGDHDGIAEFAVPVLTSARTDTGTAQVGAAPAGYEALQVAMRSLDSLADERRFDRLALSRSMSKATSAGCSKGLPLFSIGIVRSW